MIDWPIGLSTGCFYNQDFFKCLPWIQSGGFNMIEICSFPSHLDYHDRNLIRKAARELAERDMEAYSFHAPFADHIDITSVDPDERAEAQRELLLAVEAAAQLDVRHIVLHPGPESSHRPPVSQLYECLQRASEIMQVVALRCEERGISLALENMLPHLLFGRVRDLLWLLGDMESLNVGTCLDTGHAFFSGDLHRILYKLSGHLAMIHVNDNHGHHDDHLPPGDGSIEWMPLLGQLAQTQFRGTLILELAGRDPVDPDLTMADVRRGRNHIRKLVRQLSQQLPCRITPLGSDRLP